MAMYPLAKHLMARSYLTAALTAGVIIGYIIARVETHHHISTITELIRPQPASSENQPDQTPVDARASLTTTIEDHKPIEQPIDDLERAARRLDERARSADRLGDPKLADLWRAEAAKLRDALHSKTALVNELQ